MFLLMVCCSKTSSGYGFRRCSVVSLPSTLFMGEPLMVNNNGIISFLKEVSQFTPVAFPISNDRRVVAAFWADVDNRRAGKVFYRETKDPVLLQRATSDIRRYFPEFAEFSTQWAFITTWFEVTFFGGSSFSPVNTFQIILITDKKLAFTIFNYENITWTTGMHASSGGDFAGLGGIAAQAGFNAGDGKRYFNIPGSRTDDIVDVEMTTNVGVAGHWVFRIDEAQVEVGSCNDTASVCLNLRPCLNGGRCIDDCVTGNPSYTCSCRAGFTGRRCHIDVDECSSYPCQNGGTCANEENGFICLCTAGFNGTVCEIDVDDCVMDPCQNGGTCIDGMTGYNCNCKDGYTGKHCEIADSVCDTEECENGGLCKVQNGSAVCICREGYTGEHCETEIDECDSSPCLNGGECIDLVNNYTCLCPESYTGKHCEIDPSACPDGSCQRRHQCNYIRPGRYICTCSPGFYGSNCEYGEPTILGACDPNPCQNGGTCNETDDGYVCNCPNEFAGSDCENEVLQPCNAHQQCPHGASCTEYKGTYRCICPQRPSGKDLIPSPCDSEPCQKGGTCIEQDGTYTCRCLPGFSGQHCERERLSSCASNPCRNGGTCKESHGTYQCVCLYRFTGKHCETGKPDPCSSSPCQNGGTCFHYIGKYKCECPQGFTGRHCDTEVDCGIPDEVKHAQILISSTLYGSVAQFLCEPGYSMPAGIRESMCRMDGQWSKAPVCEEIDECSSQPCLNGGTCRDGVANFHCDCQRGYTGRFCESETDDCASEPCKNGGTCQNAQGLYICHCPGGFSGNDCETVVDGCRLDPCGSRGFCRSVNGSYSCTCKVGYSGKHCAKELVPPTALKVVNAEEREIEISWHPPETGTGQQPIDGFAVTHTSYDGAVRRTDFVNKSRSRHVLRLLSSGRLYNISVFSVKRNANHNDISNPASLLVWTKPGPIANLSVANVTASSITIAWSLPNLKQPIVDRIHLLLRSGNAGGDTTVLLGNNVTNYTFDGLSPGEVYTLEAMARGGLMTQEYPVESLWTRPLLVRTRPLPAQNLVLAGVASTTAKIQWSYLAPSMSDGFIINVTSGHSIKSRYVPNGRLTAYVLHDLTAGQQYEVALMAVQNTERGKLLSEPVHLLFTTAGSEDSSGKQEKRGNSRAGAEEHNRLRLTLQPKPGVTAGEFKDVSRQGKFSELLDGRARISATFTDLQQRSITHRTRPEPPIKLENLEEDTNRISLALEIPEAETNTKPSDQWECSSNPCKNGGTCVRSMDSYTCDCDPGFKGKNCELFCKKTPHSCTRLYSETKTIPVWEDHVWRFKYKRIYKVHQDTCYKEVCEPVVQRRPRNRRIFIH
eukprot:gi/632935107/ref/XP_007887824.1/ PREDICTED: sushi, nidogen and EGF-like domain-containing protein 1 [Callorhinchus milii]